MPTSSATLAVVAARLGGFPPEDDEAVGRFYRVSFPALPGPVRELIAEFLIATTALPTAEDLAELVAAIDAPEALPPLDAPAWPGEAMSFLPYAALDYAEPRAATAGAAAAGPGAFRSADAASAAGMEP